MAFVYLLKSERKLRILHRITERKRKNIFMKIAFYLNQIGVPMQEWLKQSSSWLTEKHW